MLFSTPSEDVAPSPDYCQQCGNLDFYAERFGWWCHWCKPMSLRKIEYDRSNKKPPKPIGEAVPERPFVGFFTPAETLAVWAKDFDPVTPCGPALSAVRLRARNEKK